jgi:hypothetical protein
MTSPAPLAQNPDKKIAFKTYDAQKSSVTKMIKMLITMTLNNVLLPCMGLKFTKYSSLITDTAKFTTVNDNYLSHYT